MFNFFKQSAVLLVAYSLAWINDSIKKYSQNNIKVITKDGNHIKGKKLYSLLKSNISGICERSWIDLLQNNWTKNSHDKIHLKGNSTVRKHILTSKFSSGYFSHNDVFTLVKVLFLVANLSIKKSDCQNFPSIFVAQIANIIRNESSGQETIPELIVTRSTPTHRNNRKGLSRLWDKRQRRLKYLWLTFKQRWYAVARGIYE